MDRSLDESIADRRRQVRLVLLPGLTDSSRRPTITTATALREIAVLLEMVSKRYVINSLCFALQSYLVWIGSPTSFSTPPIVSSTLAVTLNTRQQPSFFPRSACDGVLEALFALVNM